MILIMSGALRGCYGESMNLSKSLTVALTSTFAALAVGLLLQPWLVENPPFMLFVLPVLISGYLGGMGTGLFTTWLGATLGRFFFLEPLYRLTMPDSDGLAQLILFILVGSAISIMAPFARRGQQLQLQMVQQESERIIREATLEERAVQDERQRLSRELHDSVSQAFYGIGLGARTALAQLKTNPAAIEAPLAYVLKLAESGLAEMRALVHELRPEMLESEGLAAALTHQAQTMAARYELQARLSLNEPKVSLTHKHGLYRVAMEALHNVVKHARAKSLVVRLEEIGEVLLLEVKDDGQGFDSYGEFPGHWGIRTMKERVERLGGTLHIVSSHRQGTTVRVELPRRWSARSV